MEEILYVITATVGESDQFIACLDWALMRDVRCIRCIQIYLIANTSYAREKAVRAAKIKTVVSCWKILLLLCWCGVARVSNLLGEGGRAWQAPLEVILASPWQCREPHGRLFRH